MLGFGYFLYLYMNSTGLTKDSYTSTCYTLEHKAFLSNICCESYRDLAPFVEERTTLEKNFPTYSEEQKSGKDLRWGDFKLGRLPAFLYDDLSSQSRCAERNDRKNQSPVMSQMDDSFEAAQYKSSFDSAFQYKQSRCQNHIHKLGPNGRRNVPNACKSKRNPNECKHEYPRTNLVSPSWMYLVINSATYD